MYFLIRRHHTALFFYLPTLSLIRIPLTKKPSLDRKSVHKIQIFSFYTNQSVLAIASVKSLFTFVWVAKSVHLLTAACTWSMMASAFLMFIFLATCCKSFRVMSVLLELMLRECWLTHALPGR